MFVVTFAMIILLFTRQYKQLQSNWIVFRLKGKDCTSWKLDSVTIFAIHFGGKCSACLWQCISSSHNVTIDLKLTIMMCKGKWPCVYDFDEIICGN